jgi:hypothetical protein
MNNKHSITGCELPLPTVEDEDISRGKDLLFVDGIDQNVRVEVEVENNVCGAIHDLNGACDDICTGGGT